jgi:hypothetical protein
LDNEDRKLLIEITAEMRELKGELREFKEHIRERIKRLEQHESGKPKFVVALVSMLAASGALILTCTAKLFGG